MIRFREFEKRTGCLAAMTETHDGDFSTEGIPEHFSALTGASDLELRGLHLVQQVHGVKAVRVDRLTEDIQMNGIGDALYTDSPNLAMGLRVADCVPIFLVCPKPRCACLVHAGRVGTLQGIAAKSVETLCLSYGCDASRITALLGPSAGPCCYEVDEETAMEFSDRGLCARRRFVDLWESNRRQLLDAGLRPDRVDIAGVCTICTPAFHSYRRTGTKERNLALLRL